MPSADQRRAGFVLLWTIREGFKHIRRIGNSGKCLAQDSGNKSWVRQRDNMILRTFTVYLIVAFICQSRVWAGDSPDAVSRSVSVSNVTEIGQFGVAVSRALSVRNNLSIISPETGAVSRAIGVQNDLAALISWRDALSRALAAENTFLCLGNMTDDGLVMEDDIPAFVAVLIGADDNLYLQQAADLNCDGTANGIDIQLFLDSLFLP